MPPQPHPSSIHFIALPTTRTTINDLVQRSHELLSRTDPYPLPPDVSRSLAADLCCAAAMLLIEPTAIIPHPLNVHPRPPTPPSPSPTSVRPLSPKPPLFNRPTSPQAAQKQLAARITHVQMLLQCITFSLSQTLNIRNLLLSQREKLGLVSPTGATPDRLPTAQMLAFKNVSQFAANFIDHFLHELKPIHDMQLNRIRALQILHQNLTNLPRTTAQGTSFQSLILETEDEIRSQTKHITVAYCAASAPAELLTDAQTKRTPRDAPSVLRNLALNSQARPMLHNVPPPLQLRSDVQPVPQASVLNQMVLDHAPFLEDYHVQQALQSAHAARRRQ
ncbi:hypothetical protein BWQ96_03241 [Gracilariopsis chorda]|uniref:Uncharacterized protein n=1 Tax=Gracilariopsis chorda TaxID=448386 RepID=A0A2V3IXW2_9FLOR|nr:hypothetical protein BWQ96_03241 [Gracilariopsis chorda]|eukprot:PXF46903.1 hypothetical protein BWQ96_03241 [Gracilariopsis chorda]